MKIQIHNVQMYVIKDIIKCMQAKMSFFTKDNKKEYIF